MKKFLLSSLLAMFLLGFGGIGMAAEYHSIHQVDVTADIPEVGEKVSNVINTLGQVGETLYGIDSVNYEKKNGDNWDELNPNDEFECNENYRVVLRLQVLDKQYDAFNNESMSAEGNIKINGETGEYLEYSGFFTKIKIGLEFTLNDSENPGVDSNIITSIGITGVVYPTVGQTVQDAYNSIQQGFSYTSNGYQVYTYNDSNDYHFDFRIWDDDYNDWSPMDINDKFTANDAYRVGIRFMPMAGYSFGCSTNECNNVIIAINGANRDESRLNSDQNAGWLMAYKDFTLSAPAQTEISEITISGITDPVLGQYSTTQGIIITPDNGEIQLVPDYLSWRKVSNNLDSGSASKFTDEYEAYRLQIVYNPIEGYEMADDYTVNVQDSNYATITTGHTSLGYYIRIEYPVSQMPQEIDHILLIGDLGNFVHGTTPPTNITTNTTGINLGAVTWGKGSSCTPLEANETFVSSSNYDDYYCLTIPFTVDTGYVLRNNYYIYRKNIGADRSTDRVYASDEEYACTPSEIKIKYLYAVHTVNFIVDGQPRDETRYRRNGCPLYGCNGYYASLRAPTKEGYIFEGWYTEDTFVNKLNWYSSGVTENMTLYANWINKINTITISGVTVPTRGAQATLSGIEKSADPITGVNWGTLVWKVPTTDEPEDPQPVDFNGIFQGGKSYRLYVPFTIAEGYGIQKGYSNTTIFTVNGTQKDINYDIGCSNSSCSAWLSYYVPYIITFYDGETVYTTGTAYGGDTINYTWSITNPYVPGKKFLGWFKDPEFTQQRRLDTDTVTGDMNLYGKFANQLMNINLTGVVAPEGNVTATVAGISLAEGTSGVQLGTLKWQEGESDFNGKFVSGTQYTLYVPFKLIDDYVMPDYYSYVSLSVNGEYFYKEIGSTGNEDYPYYIRTYFTAKAPGTGASEPAPSAGGSSGGGSGGGRIIVTNDKQETEVKNTENNKQDEDKSEENKSEEKQENNTENPENTQNDSQKVLEDGLTQEFHDAYDFAYKNGITTMKSAKEANMNSPLTRIAMAKMLSNYAINVLGKKPANKVVPKFPDIDEKLNEDYGGAVDLAYQLGIMGIGIENFRPFDLVPRAEFVTALSRMLYGIADGDDVYYETHMKKLKEEGIITNDNPNLQEVRGYVMIMLMRSAK